MRVKKSISVQIAYLRWIEDKMKIFFKGKNK